MPVEALLDYLRTAQRQGYAEEEIRKVLLEAGWDRKAADDAFTFLKKKESSFPRSSLEQSGGALSSLSRPELKSFGRASLPTKNFIPGGTIIEESFSFHTSLANDPTRAASRFFLVVIILFTVLVITGSVGYMYISYLSQ